MLDMVYEWIQNVVFFLLLAGAVLDALPGESYRKYIRFFIGMIVLLLLASPLLKLGNLQSSFDNLYHSLEYEQTVREAQQMEQYFEKADLFDYIPEEYLEKESKTTNSEAEEKIEVEEIRIGE